MRFAAECSDHHARVYDKLDASTVMWINIIDSLTKAEAWELCCRLVAILNKD